MVHPIRIRKGIHVLPTGASCIDLQMIFDLLTLILDICDLQHFQCGCETFKWFGADLLQQKRTKMFKL